MKPVFDRFKSVIVTSGTLSPLELYPKLLGMPRLVVSRSFSMSIDRDCMCPLVVTRGDDQVALTTRFESRDDNAVVRNYGAMVLQLAKTVPDGVVVFFTSYSYMENVVSKWDDMGILVKVSAVMQQCGGYVWATVGDADPCTQIFEHKRLFLETKDVVETTLALDNFRRTCESGRGAVRSLTYASGYAREALANPSTPAAGADVFLDRARQGGRGGRLRQAQGPLRGHDWCVVQPSAAPAQLCAVTPAYQVCRTSTHCRACCGRGWTSCASTTRCERTTSSPSTRCGRRRSAWAA